MAQYTLPRFRGELISPGEAAYDEARSVWNGMFDRHPALIARCATTEDVVAAVTLARAEGVPLAVRGGGHSAVGHSTCDDGIVIDLSAMNDVRVEPIGKTARAQGGATWGDFDTATQTFGLAVTGGRYSTTGIAGLTLGSGSGWPQRQVRTDPRQPHLGGGRHGRWPRRARQRHRERGAVLGPARRRRQLRRRHRVRVPPPRRRPAHPRRHADLPARGPRRDPPLRPQLHGDGARRPRRRLRLPQRA